MDWETIITTVVAALGGGGFGGFLGWKLKKRKETAEVKKDEIDNLRATIESVYGPIIEQLKTRISDLEGEVNELRKENARLVRENNQLKLEVYELRTGTRPEPRAFKASGQRRNPNGTFAKEVHDEAEG